MMGDLADLLRDAGAVVAGAAALFGVCGFVAGSLVRDLARPEVRPMRWAEIGAQFGGLFAMSALLWRLAGVH